MADDAAEARRLLAGALEARRTAPALLVDPTRKREPLVRLAESCASAELPTSLRIAAAVLDDRLEDALAERVSDTEGLTWRAVALRRAGQFTEARRAYRAVGARPEHPLLYQRALRVLQGGNGGFRWVSETAAHLLAHGRWDPIWFVDACAAVHTGVLSRESATLLEEIQWAELQLMLDAGGAG